MPSLSDIRIKDLKLGKLDAKNELLNGTSEEKRFFENSFLMPENVTSEDFINNQIFFVTGMKGTGKTALLRFLDIEIQKRFPNSITEFILFKSDISDEERDKFTNASNSFIVNKETVDPNEHCRYENVWIWFFFRQILRLSEESSYAIFENNQDWQNFKECVNRPAESKSESWFSNLGIKLRHGNVTVSAASEHLSASLGLDFDIEARQPTMKFSKLVQQANILFDKLTPTAYPVFIFIDELEVSMANKKLYTRDIQMVRDLILAIERFNRKCLRLRYKIKLIAGIRTEVLSAPEISGHEINKSIADFGHPLNWQHSGDDYKNHPLMKMLVKRIKASEHLLGVGSSSDDDIWRRYFPASINLIPIQKFLLQQTWERPRDIIRLLDISKKHFGNEPMFSQKVFEGIAKEYSKESWVEMTEELTATYKPDEINGLRDLLTGLKSPFSYEQIKKEAEIKCEFSDNLVLLLKNYKIADILRRLYKVGIIGNAGKMVRFAFRGDDEILLHEPMKIIDPLWKYLTISRRS